MTKAECESKSVVSSILEDLLSMCVKCEFISILIPYFRLTSFLTYPLFSAPTCRKETSTPGGGVLGLLESGSACCYNGLGHSDDRFPLNEKLKDASCQADCLYMDQDRKYSDEVEVVQTEMKILDVIISIHNIFPRPLEETFTTFACR